ncbi:MAG: branched-chain amino acid transport system ATP-binding protein [Oceanospirillaceae bacterium]|jgi:branched-chain amino acid transport system ATP-binding protein
MTQPLLQVLKLTAHYGVAQALFDVNLTILPGQVVALMGRNGMGKTTTVNVVCGLLGCTSGEVHFNGHDCGQMASYKIARLGIGLVPEGRRCFANLTVRENLLVAATQGEWTLEKVCGLLPRLKERLDQYANTLSGGEQQMLAIGRALLTNPKLLILDEATEGLAPVIRQEIWHIVASLKDAGQSILLIDKSLAELLPITDLCVLLERGSTVWQGAPEELNADLRDRYLGI